MLGFRSQIPMPAGWIAHPLGFWCSFSPLTYRCWCTTCWPWLMSVDRRRHGTFVSLCLSLPLSLSLYSIQWLCTGNYVYIETRSRSHQLAQAIACCFNIQTALTYFWIVMDPRLKRRSWWAVCNDGVLTSAGTSSKFCGFVEEFTSEFSE
jgi:hypothetical protein